MPTPENDRPPDRASFAHQTVAFSGKLASLGRREAHALVERLGGVVAAEVSARTTMLVIGAEGVRAPRAQGAAGSAPARTRRLQRAEELNDRTPGRVAIVSEDEFCRLGGLHRPRRFAAATTACAGFASATRCCATTAFATSRPGG